MTAIARLKRKLRDTHHGIFAKNALRFAVDLNARMKQLGIRKKDLASKVGVSPSRISKVLRGDENFTLETMAKLAHAVDADIEVRLVDRPVMRTVVFDFKPSVREVQEIKRLREEIAELKK